MKTNRRVWSVTPVFILIAAVALWGSHPVEAKKRPKPPPAQWEVEIPDCGELESDPYNLCGMGQTIYVETSDEDGVGVDVVTERDRETGMQVSEFTLVVYKCEWYEACFGLNQPDQITLQNFVFGAYDLGEGPPCIFPEPSMSECETFVAPECMQCFINGGHPYGGHKAGWMWPHEDDYTWIYFRVIVPGSFEDIQQGIQVLSSGELEMHLRGQHTFLPTGYEEGHFVRAHADLPGDAVTIIRFGDSWTVEVTVNIMTFFEGYRGCGRRNPSGKCVGGWDYVYPLWADIAETLHFTATWTRTTP
jgi:hypothetical protein